MTKRPYNNGEKRLKKLHKYADNTKIDMAPYRSHPFRLNRRLKSAGAGIKHRGHGNDKEGETACGYTRKSFCILWK